MRKFNPIISTFRVSLSVLLKADLVCRFWLSFPHLSPIMKWMFRNTCFSLKFSSLTHSSALSHSRFLCYVACVCSRKRLNLYVLQGKRIQDGEPPKLWILFPCKTFESVRFTRKKDSQFRGFAILNRNYILYLLHSYFVLSYSKWQLRENLKAKTINSSVYDTNVFFKNHILKQI